MKGHDIFAQMQAGNPVAAYKKTVPSLVHVKVLNPFDQETPESVIMRGDAKKGEIDAFIALWTEKELLFFKRANRTHINDRTLVEAEYPGQDSQESNSNTFSDEEIEGLVNSPFLALKNAVEKMTSEASVYAVLETAERLEKSEKILNFLRERISLIQSGLIETE